MDSPDWNAWPIALAGGWHGIEWITAIWFMIAAVSLTLAGIHFAVWARQRSLRVHLIFSITALSAAAFTLIEVAMLRAMDPQDYAVAVRWYHVAAFFVVVSLVFVVRGYLGAGRIGLAWSICAVRLLSLVLNFTTGENLNYAGNIALRWYTLLGQRVAGATGDPNPMMLVGQASLLMLCVFIIDAVITTWRRGDRRRALYVGGALVLLIVSGTLQPVLYFWGFAAFPLMIGPFFVGVLAVMAIALSGDIMNTVRLAEVIRDQEAKVRLGEERLDLAADAANIGLWSVHATSGAIWASERARSMYGVPADETLTLATLDALLHHDDRSAFQRALAASLDSSAPFQHEYRIVRRDGTTRWMLARGRVVTAGGDQGGASERRLVGASVDITDGKDSEQRLAELTGQLGRTARVALLGELAGTIAHELNQPLAGILSTAQAAELSMVSPCRSDVDFKEMLGDIISDTKRAASVIRNLHDLYRNKEADMAWISMGDLVVSSRHLINSELVMRGIVCDFDVAADTEAFGSRLQLQQVVLNLMMNAMQAIERRRPPDRRVKVLLSVESGGCCLVVEDTGDGMPPDKLGEVFSPVEVSRSGGMGLGLALCRRIITAHGGTLFAENRQEGGARVGFTLPQAKAMR
jgi:PAS domain S-box-containing protein